jgi:hypothetical protein
MIHIEFIKFLRGGFLVRKPRLIKEFTAIHNMQKKYVESFTFKKYLYKNIIFKENKILSLLLIISFSFLLIMIYHFICFIFYTIDLYITFVLKSFFDTLVFTLEQ